MLKLENIHCSLFYITLAFLGIWIAMQVASKPEPLELSTYKVTLVNVVPVSGKIRSAVVRAYSESDARQIVAERYRDSRWLNDTVAQCVELKDGVKCVVMETVWP